MVKSSDKFLLFGSIDVVITIDLNLFRFVTFVDHFQTDPQ
jgi:hypothetical protein